MINRRRQIVIEKSTCTLHSLTQDNTDVTADTNVLLDTEVPHPQFTYTLHKAIHYQIDTRQNTTRLMTTNHYPPGWSRPQKNGGGEGVFKYTFLSLYLSHVHLFIYVSMYIVLRRVQTNTKTHTHTYKVIHTPTHTPAGAYRSLAMMKLREHLQLS